MAENRDVWCLRIDGNRSGVRGFKGSGFWSSGFTPNILASSISGAPSNLDILSYFAILALRKSKSLLFLIELMPGTNKKLCLIENRFSQSEIFNWDEVFKLTVFDIEIKLWEIFEKEKAAPKSLS